MSVSPWLERLPQPPPDEVNPQAAQAGSTAWVTIAIAAAPSRAVRLELAITSDLMDPEMSTPSMWRAPDGSTASKAR